MNAATRSIVNVMAVVASLGVRPDDRARAAARQRRGRCEANRLQSCVSTIHGIDHAWRSVTLRGNISMGKIRRGGCIFISWKSDHPPRHVHVYREGKLIVKWDNDNNRPMKGAASAEILDLIRALQAEGRL